MVGITEDKILCQNVIGSCGKSFTGGVTKSENKGTMPRNGYCSLFPKGETLILLSLSDFFFNV